MEGSARYMTMHEKGRAEEDYEREQHKRKTKIKESGAVNYVQLSYGCIDWLSSGSPSNGSSVEVLLMIDRSQGEPQTRLVQ